MKRSSVITLILAGVLITNCVSCLNDKKTNRNNEPEETEETTVETTATPTPTMEPTSTPTPTPAATSTPTPAPAKSEITAIDDLTSDELYSLYRQYAEEINNGQEGLLYGYHYTRLAAGNDYFWALSVVYPDGTFSDYASVDGDMTDITDDLITNYQSDSILTYDDFMKLPCLAENFFLSKSEIADTIEDGKYFGDAFNFTSDGKYMFAVVGDPVTVTREEFEALEVGDVICTGLYGSDYVVTDIYEYEGKKQVTVSDDCWFVNNEFTLDEDTYLLVSSSNNPEFINPMVLVLPIADDCIIDDQFELIAPEGYDDYVAGLEDPNVITSSVFWYQMLYDTERLSIDSDYGNGWVRAKALLYPVVIEDGQVVEVTLTWR